MQAEVPALYAFNPGEIVNLVVVSVKREPL